MGPARDDPDKIMSEIEGYIEAGVTHFVPEPRQRDLENYKRSVEVLAELFNQAGVKL